MQEESGRRRGRPAWVTYTVLRALSFLVPFFISYALGASLLLAGVIAAVIALCISVIFLTRQRAALGQEIDAVRHGRRLTPAVDEDVEDAVVERSSSSSVAQNASDAASPKP